jgi:outer membrane receptor protein involved in Fe transport
VTEWLTLNAGLRHDRTKSFRRDEATSPRLNLVLTPAFDLTIHAGYARYFLPAPSDTIADSPRDLAATTGRTPTSVGSRALPETDDYWDVGVQKKFDHLTVGLDAYLRQAKDLIDRGEFLASNEARVFNYGRGRLRGVELSLLYGAGPLSGWANLAVARAEGSGGILSNQFYFTPAELAYASAHHVRLATDQTVTASGGASYRIGSLRLAGDVLYGSGYRGTAPGGPPNGRGLPGHVQLDLAAVYRLTLFDEQPLELRMDIVNALNDSYVIHDGSGFGDGRPQFGPRRGVFVGFEQSF